MLELQFLGTALLNIATNKHTKFPSDDEICSEQARDAIENEGQMGK